MPAAPPAEPSGGKGPDSGTCYSGASWRSERDCIRPVATSTSESRQLPPSRRRPPHRVRTHGQTNGYTGKTSGRFSFRCWDAGAASGMPVDGAGLSVVNAVAGLSSETSLVLFVAGRTVIAGLLRSHRNSFRIPGWVPLLLRTISSTRLKGVSATDQYWIKKFVQESSLHLLLRE